LTFGAIRLTPGKELDPKLLGPKEPQVKVIWDQWKFSACVNSRSFRQGAQSKSRDRK